MQHCPECNKVNQGAFNFCWNCGAALRNVVNKEIEKLGSEIKQLKKENDSFQNKVAELKEQLADDVINREINQLRNEKIKQEENISRLNGLLTSANREINQLHNEKTKNKLLEENISRLNGLLSSANVEKNQLYSEKNVLKKDNDSLKKQVTELNKKDATIEKLKVQLAEEKEGKNRQEAYQFRSKYYISLGFIVLIFVITTIILSSKNNALDHKINHIENKVIPPLQSTHNFTPQNYKSIVDRCYFYDDNFNRTNRYILYGEKLKIIRMKDNFAYGIYTDSKGKTVFFGWVRLGDLEAK